MDTTGIRSTMRDHVAMGVGGLAWGVDVDGTVHQGAEGWFDFPGRERPMTPDGIFRLASVSKPIAAVAALQLVDDGLLGLDQPVDTWLPELSDRRVLVDPTGEPDGPTVAANRSLTLRDLLSHRCGLGMSFDFTTPQPLLDRLWELGIGPGPYGPDCTPDEFMARLAPLPIADQPGTVWRYHVGSDIASVLVERVRGERLDAVMEHRVFAPAGMVDTGFTIRPDQAERLGDSRSPGEDGTMAVWDTAAGRWSADRPFRSGAADLVSTVADLLAFGRALLDGRLLSDAMRGEMLRDQLADDPAGAADGQGWGLGVGVLRDADPSGWPGPGSFGWDGGLGSRWILDVEHRVVAALLTTDAWASPEPPAVMGAFNAAVGAALRSA